MWTPEQIAMLEATAVTRPATVIQEQQDTRPSTVIDVHEQQARAATTKAERRAGVALGRSGHFFLARERPGPVVTISASRRRTCARAGPYAPRRELSKSVEFLNFGQILT